MEALRDMHLPPGFGFHPSDTELVSHYLKRKILGQKIEYDLIPEVDIYKHEPWDLPAKCTLPIEDNKWHFFASRDRKYPTGSRSNRATLAGYWKSTGKDRAIKMNKRTLGTKKTLVFHKGRPPSGRRTEWIMHEYYIDENECQANPEMKDAFVLCRVTKRNDWALENDNEVGNRIPHPKQLNDAATSVVSAENPKVDAAIEESNHVATPVVSPELSNDISMTATTAGTPNDGNGLQASTAGIPNDGDGLQAWLEELIDPSFNPVVDTGSADLSLTEQHAEALGLHDNGPLSPKIELDHASPTQNGTDVTDYLLPEDFQSMWYPGIDYFSNGMLLELADQAGADFGTNQAYSMVGMNHFPLPNNLTDGTLNDELLLPQENINPNLPNENDNGIIIRRRNASSSAANFSPASRNMKMQVGLKKMVANNSESINQTVKFADNSGRCLDLTTNVEYQKKDATATASVKQSFEGPSEDHSDQGYFRGIKNVFSCSSAGVKLLFTVCLVGIVAVVLQWHHRSGLSI